MFVYSPSNVREIDRIAIEEAGIPGYTLMTRAGQAAFADARDRFPDANRWLVVCGAGNNAGDGYVIARLALAAHLEVVVATVADPESLQGDAATAWSDFRAAADESADTVISAFDASLCADVDLIVDALLGTGIDRPVEGEYLSVINTLMAATVPILAVDVPSGLNSETGAVMGAAVKAALTVTFVGLKQGFYLAAGPDHTGSIQFHDLDIPARAAASVEPALHLFEPEDLRALLPPRPATAHKGQFGHVLVIGGNRGMGGSVRMAGEAALRVGAGLVTVACHPDVAAGVTASRPELMGRGIAEPGELDALLERATVVVLGPGLGTDDWARSIFQQVITSAPPKVLDADALNLLADQSSSRDDWVLTPHPGEAGRLLGCSTAAVQADRLRSVRELTNRYGGTVVLKGRCTLIAQSGKLPILIDRGNAGMATAGMGDVLTGLTAGLLAQLPSAPHSAAAAAAFVHATAGDMAAAAGERGLLATDLFPCLRELINPNG
jgi:hydroxyethylthiazole kinase-like uncharacterized protein yjeF